MRKAVAWAVGIGIVAVLLAAVGYVARFRPTVTAVPAAHVDAVSQKTGLADCFWVGVSTQGGLVSYPDTGASYWLTQFTLPRGSVLEFSGEFPHARHVSFNVYDQQGQPLDRLNDFMIEPRAGSTNPYRTGARRDATERSYTFRLAAADLNAGTPIAELDGRRSGNTLFMPDGPEPTRLWMRIYVPDRGLDAKGGTPLPIPTLRLADGSLVTGESLCRQIVVKEAAVLTANLAKGPNQSLLSLASSTSPFHPAQPQPRWFAFYNPPYAVVPYLVGTRFEWLRSLLSTQRKGGFFSTLDNTYMAALIDQRFGEVLVLTGRAPRTPATLAGTAVMQGGELRYWSLCQYHSLHDPSVQSCVYDEQVPTDAAGNFTIVVSTAGNRPANATIDCGVAWMDFGEIGDGMGNPAGAMLVYRQMMPAADFKQSLFETRVPGDEARVLGTYYPAARYMDRAAFERLACTPRVQR
jgi:hypothetical protein